MHLSCMTEQRRPLRRKSARETSKIAKAQKRPRDQQNKKGRVTLPFEVLKGLIKYYLMPLRTPGKPEASQVMILKTM